jgi:hypothetical protein
MTRNLAFGVLVLELLHAAFASPRLAVRAVRVAGARQLTAQRVGGLASVPAGANVLSVNLGDVRRRVMRDPAVRDAHVTRALPDGIRIVVEERRPRMVATMAGRFWDVDEAGIPFREQRAPTPGLPLVDLGVGRPPALGKSLPGDRWRAVLTCADLGRKNRLPVRKILFDDGGELWLNIAIPGTAASGERLLPVRLGRLEDLPEKLAQLRWVLPVAAADGQYLDLMCPGRAAYQKGSPPLTGGTGAWRRPAPAAGPGAEQGPPHAGAAPGTPGGLGRPPSPR